MSDDAAAFHGETLIFLFMASQFFFHTKFLEFLLYTNIQCEFICREKLQQIIAP